MIVYQWDEQGFFVGSVEAGEAAPMPERSTPTPPMELTGDEVAQWQGVWVKLVERPIPPETGVEPGPEIIQNVPSSVTMRQARLTLHAAGLLSLVQPAIDALPEPSRTTAQIEWDYSSEVFRDKPFVNMLGAQLGLSGEQIDNLFIEAATL